MYKYKKTWAAIEAALAQSQSWSEPEKYYAETAEDGKARTLSASIQHYIDQLRDRAADKDIIEWNVTVCAGLEMQHDPKAPVWSEVIRVWREEKEEHEHDAVPARCVA